MRNNKRRKRRGKQNEKQRRKVKLMDYKPDLLSSNNSQMTWKFEVVLKLALFDFINYCEYCNIVIAITQRC